MTFKEAKEYAYNNNSYFRQHADKVARHEEMGCLLFAIGDEAFSYGFTCGGVVKVKHNPTTSCYHIKSGRCLIIRQKEGEKT